MEKRKQEKYLKLLEPVRIKLYRYIKAVCKNNDLTDDIMSETILQSYENFEKLRNEEAFLSFVFTIANRIYKKYKWRRRFFGEYNEEFAHNIKDINNSPETDYEIQLLYNAMERLPVKQKQAVALFEISGFSIKEISEIQKSSQNTIKSRIKRGRDKLKEWLESDIEKGKSVSQKKISEIELSKI